MRDPGSKLRIDDPDRLAEECSRLRQLGQKLVLTTGAYDVLHEGHLWYLHQSRCLGDALVVAINSDRFVKALKGDSRPIFDERHRAFMIAGFECVDLVTIFDDDNTIVELVRPDLLVMSATSQNGPQERAEQVRILQNHGGSYIILPAKSQIHSTGVIEKIRTKE